MALFFSDKKAPLNRIKKGDFEDRQELQDLFELLMDEDQHKIGDVGWMLTDHRREIRALGSKFVQTKNLKGTFEYVFKQATTQKGPAQRVLLALLPKLREPRALGILQQALDSKHRKLAVSGIMQFPARDIFTMLVEFLKDRDSEVRLQALGKIAQTVEEVGKLDPRVRQLIQPLAHDREEKIRLRVFDLLSQQPDEHFVDLILERIREERYSGKKKLISILESTPVEGNSAVIDKIVPLLSEGDDLIRNAALTVATKAGNPAEVVLKIILFSKSLMGWMRDRIHQTMTKFGTRLLDPVLDLLGHQNAEIRASALLFAVNFPSEKLVEPCIRLMNEEDWWTRAVAIDTLGTLKDDRAVEPLIRCLEDPEVRWSAVEALARIGSAKSIGHIAKLLGDPAAEIRTEVVRALEIFDDARSLPLLKKVYKEDSELSVREAALQAFKNIKKSNKLEVNEDEIRSEFGYDTSTASPVDLLLIQTRKMGASDFHLSSGQRPAVRHNGELKKLGEVEYSAEKVRSLLEAMLTPEQHKLLEEFKQFDCSYEVPGAGRYRANVFEQRVGLAAVYRVISNEIPTVADIGLPEHLEDIVNIHQGLVIVSGASGSGKTTTLAALVDLFNERKRAHVLTLEDPIEYVHPVKNCLISQREIGTHSVDFPTALRAALREDPDVIVVGEMRDAETMRMAITASETGHLVIATMHTTSAYKSVSRLVESFPAREQPQVRMMLSESLMVVMNQGLLPRKDGKGRVAYFEVLMNTGAVGNLIRDNKLPMIPSLMTIGYTKGMRTVDDSLRELVQADKITGDIAYARAANKEEFEQYVSQEFLEGVDD